MPSTSTVHKRTSVTTAIDLLWDSSLSNLRSGYQETRKLVDRDYVDFLLFTDLCARLNSFKNDLDKLNEQAKSRIKTELIQDGRTISEGYNFIATLTSVEVARLDTDRVKVFLGRRLMDYVNVSEERRLVFKPKGV